MKTLPSGRHVPCKIIVTFTFISSSEANYAETRRKVSVGEFVSTAIAAGSASRLFKKPRRASRVGAARS